MRFRGFWQVKKGEKGFGKKGKSKGEGKGSLAGRIANSYCRVCMKKGHWKNECPLRSSATNASSASSTVVPPTFAVTDDLPEALVNMAVAVTDETWLSGKKCCIREGIRWDKLKINNRGKWGNHHGSCH